MISRFLWEASHAVVEGATNNSKEQTLPTDSVVSHYRIIRQLGEGGQGKVYLARDTKLDRDVALKILTAESVKDENRLKRFVNEATNASKLNHENILTIHQYGESGGIHFIDAEVVDGETLRTRMMREKLGLLESLEIAIQVARALHAAHEAKITHCDIKPENIMLRHGDDVAKVLDFGIAKLTQIERSEATTEKLTNTDPNKVIGTLHYMSPEQVKGRHVDARTDIWSLGVVLYEMVAHRRPFVGLPKRDLVDSILETDPPPINLYLKKPPKELKQILSKALHKDSRKRYQDAREMARSMADLKDKLEHPPSMRYRVLAITLIAVLLVATVVISLYSFHTSPDTPIDSLVVLPFTYTGPDQIGDSEKDFLAEGITENITYSLSRRTDLHVIARSTASAYKNQDPSTVGKKLSVRAVVTGRITQHGDELTISAELMDLKDNRQIWGNQYNRKLSELPALQADISSDISKQLRSKVTGHDQNVTSQVYTENAEALAAYSAGRHFWNKRTEAGLRKGIEYFNEAIDKDPNYSRAYAGLADCYALLGFYEYLEPGDAYPKAKVAATKAINLDDNLSEAHTSLAYVMAFYEWDWPGAENEFQKAIDRNANDETAHHWYALLLGRTGRVQQAASEIARAQQIDPLSPIIQRSAGLLFYYARQYDEAIKQYKKISEIDPNFMLAHVHLGEAYAQKGMFADAETEFHTAIGLSPKNPAILADLGWLYALSGRRREAEAALSQLMDMANKQYISPFNIAKIYTGLLDKDRAFEWLDRALKERSDKLVLLKADPAFDVLHKDRRYDGLIQSIRLT